MPPAPSGLESRLDGHRDSGATEGPQLERDRPDRARVARCGCSSGLRSSSSRIPRGSSTSRSSASLNGAIYGLVALGYTLVYGILQLINFAHGDVFALSGLVASTMIISVFGLDEDDRRRLIIVGVAGTLAVTIPLFALINAGIERVAYKPLRKAPRLAPLITAVGMSFIVQNIGLARLRRRVRGRPELHTAYQGVHDRRGRDPVGQPRRVPHRLPVLRVLPGSCARPARARGRGRSPRTRRRPR